MPGVLVPRYPRGCLSAIESATLVFKLSFDGSRTELYLVKMSQFLLLSKSLFLLSDFKF